MDYKKKIVAFFLLIILLLSVPHIQAVQASDFGAAVWARYFKDILVKAAAQAAFKVLSNKVISKIQSSGLDEKAAFVQNWINFATEAQYRGEAIFRSELSTAKLCNYFAKDIKSVFGVGLTDSISIDRQQNVRTDSLDPYDLKTECTMPSGFNTSNYQKDFAGNGGWDAFSRMLEPQNNYYGTLFTSLDEVAKQRKLSESSSINEAVSGKGFTGVSGGTKGCTLRGSGNKCLIKGDIKTPGSTLEGATSDVTSRGTTALLATADGASIAVSALTTWVLNKMFDLAGTNTNISEDVEITSEQRTAESYQQEFCTAQDNISKEAGFFIRDKFPQAFGPRNHDGKNYDDLGGTDPTSGKQWVDIVGSLSFPLEHNKCDGGNDICGKSFCSWATEQYHSENSYPYSRCSQACIKAVRFPSDPTLPAPKFKPTIPSSSEGGEFVACDDPPKTTSPDPQSIMSEVKRDFPNLDLTKDGPGPDTRDEFTAIVAWRLYKADANWGRKRAGGPQSTDTLGYLRPDIGPGRFEAIDIVNSSGALQRGCYGVVDSSQTWIEPSPAP